MGIEPPYIGLYGVWSMVGIEVRGMAEAGCYWGVVWVGQWRFRVFRIRTATLSCARILRDSTPKNRVRWLFLLHTKDSVAVIWDDIVCLTIRYHENDTLASKTACKSP